MQAVTKLFSVLALISATEAAASEIDNMRQQAEQHITKVEQQRCLEDFSRKVKSAAPVMMNGNFAFNDTITRQVYNTLYWKNSDRGVVFTVPVRASDPQKGERVANLACFYAVSNEGIAFQGSQQVAWQAF